MIFQNKLTIYSSLRVFHHVRMPHEFPQAPRRQIRAVEGVVSRQNSLASHASFMSQCIPDLFNVARNVLFAHMFNVDWWMRWGFFVAAVLVWAFFFFFILFSSRAFDGTVANGLKVLINSSYFLNGSHVGCALVAVLLPGAVAARCLLFSKNLICIKNQCCVWFML